MSRLLLVAFLFFVSCSALAQTYIDELRPDYSIFDSLPDPAKHHIASRTIYLNDVAGHKIETWIEQYDHHGNLLMCSDHDSSTLSGGENSRFAHYCQYDVQDRVVRDSGVYDTVWMNKSMHFLITCTYDGERQCATEHLDEYGERSTLYIYYDKNNNITAEYLLDNLRDTVWREIHHGNTTISIHRQRNADQQMETTDSSVTTTTPSDVFEHAWFNWRGQGELREAYRYNQKGQLTDYLTWLDDSLLRDSTDYHYDRHGKLVGETDFIFPLNNTSDDTIITTWHTAYIYDHRGRMTKEVNWCSKNPARIYTTVYSYNRRGLRTRMRYTVKDGKGNEELMSEERWEYTYW